MTRMMMLAMALVLPMALSGSSWAMSCGRNGPDPECLDVLTHSPSHLPKCYCTDLCEESLDLLKASCASGQLLEDGCGACLICARAQGQRCGGNHNVLGVCASGLSCLVTFETDKENVAVGICVPNDDSRCPRSTDRPRKSGVNCRPGRLGILAEALYCPSTLRKPSRRGRLPTILGIIFGHEDNNNRGN